MGPLSSQVVWICLSALLRLCVADSSVYKLFTDSSCASTPTVLGFQESSSSICSAITTCSSVNVDGESLYWNRACETDKYDTVASTAFDKKPYVLMEIYESGATCGTLLSGAAFLADGSCLVADNGQSSMKVTLFKDGSATIVTYHGVSCSGTAVKTSTITSSSLTSHSCENGALKFYSSNATSTATTSSTTSSTAGGSGSDKSISTTTSRSAPQSFGESVLLIATLTVTLGLAIILQ